MIQDIPNPIMAIAVMVALVLGIIAEIALVTALIYGMVNIIKGIFIRRTQQDLFVLSGQKTRKADYK
ncbi:MAG: hypothetical protein WCA84_12685 [Ignavibacteriaceae bacterium]|jgi:hypothetical protein